jgi:hypothetical protein
VQVRADGRCEVVAGGAAVEAVGPGEDGDAPRRHLGGHLGEEVAGLRLGVARGEILEVEAEGVHAGVGGAQDGVAVVGGHEHHRSHDARLGGR